MAAPALSAYVQGQAAVTADNLNSFEQTCNTVADLRAFVGLPGIQVYSRGLNSVGDGYGCPYYWSAASSAADDGINVIAPAGAGTTGRWLRLPIGANSVGFLRKNVLFNVEHSVTDQFDHNYAANVFEWLSDTEITVVQSFSFGRDMTDSVQKALNQAWGQQVNLYFPFGGYLVDGGLTVPGDAAHRGNAFRMFGQGPGEIFAVAQGNLGGSILKRTTDGPALQYLWPSGFPNSSNGTTEIDHLTFIANCASDPVVNLKSNYEASSFHHNNIIQRGTGDGFHGDVIGSSNVYQNYAINPDWATLGLGAARTGIAYLFQPTINQGGPTFTNNHAKGWHDAYYVGGGTGVPILTVFDFQNEVSNCYNGYTVVAGVLSTIIDNGYFEGVDGGAAIYNRGTATKITRNNMFPGALTQIDDSDSANIGTVICQNVISLGSVAGAVGVDINASASYPGQTRKVVSDNYFAFSGSGGSIAGVVGLRMLGNLSGINHHGNLFSPVNWVGGTGTIAISDQTTNTGLAGSAQQGQNGLVEVINGNMLFTKVAQGAYGYGVPENPLADSAISSNILTTGLGSYFVLTCVNPQTINYIVAVAGKTTQGDKIKIRVTNGNITFVASSNLVLAGSVNFTPGANGATITFVSRGSFGGRPILEEQSRTAY